MLHPPTLRVQALLQALQLRRLLGQDLLRLRKALLCRNRMPRPTPTDTQRLVLISQTYGRIRHLQFSRLSSYSSLFLNILMPR
jgi:hypothetical protein